MDFTLECTFGHMYTHTYTHAHRCKHTHYMYIRMYNSLSSHYKFAGCPYCSEQSAEDSH